MSQQTAQTEYWINVQKQEAELARHAKDGFVWLRKPNGQLVPVATRQAALSMLDDLTLTVAPPAEVKAHLQKEQERKAEQDARDMNLAPTAQLAAMVVAALEQMQSVKKKGE